MSRVDTIVFTLSFLGIAAIDVLSPLGLGAFAVILATFGIVRRKAWKSNGR